MMHNALIAFALSLGIVSSTSCERRKGEKGRIAVAVTILPLADFVENLGRDKVKVVVMVPPGASPHTYEPTPEQLRRVSEAEMYVKLGSGVEFELAWLDKLSKINRKMIIVDSSEGMELIGKNPHVWLSPKNAEKMVENICDGLVRIDPGNREYYIGSKKKYIRKLEELDEYIREKLNGIENRRFMVYHPAWDYLASDYGLEQIPIERAGKEPTALEIKKAVERAKKYGIKTIFVSPQFVAKGAQVIAEEIDGRIVFLDPLPRDYINDMRIVVERLARAMRGGI
ncbi:MAG TPA: zinc ABC transporter substrate-binding protein [Candidatus Latescibacteria bacterium]|nr:zinc ABC transporter substrate-binding protein [Candidatus Latescibacterota bacterium]